MRRLTLNFKNKKGGRKTAPSLFKKLDTVIDMTTPEALELQSEMETLEVEYNDLKKLRNKYQAQANAALHQMADNKILQRKKLHDFAVAYAAAHPTEENLLGFC